MRDYRTQIMQQVTRKTTGTYMNILLRLLIFLLFLVITFLLLFLQLARLVLCFNAFLTLKKHMRDYCGQIEHKKAAL